MVHLRDQDRQAIKQMAQVCFSQPIEIWVYGSRVQGKSHEASDLDLVLRGPELKAIDLEELENFKEKLQDSQIPILIQVFDWVRLPESFQKNILKQYEIL